MRKIYLAAGPVVSLLLFILLNGKGFSRELSCTAAITGWMAIWWITEVVDLGITSLLPFALFPITGVMDTAAVSRQYMEQTIFLFMGGFFLAFAMEKWKLHERLAYGIIRKTGATPVRVLVGIMLTTFFISMWISNTATTMMMLAAVLAIVRHENLFDKHTHSKAATGYLLALTYSASIGGLATLVGTPTNMILAGFAEKLFPDGSPLTFNRWFVYAFPFALILLTALFLLLRRQYFRKEGNRPFDLSFIVDKQRELGEMRYEEKVVVGVFIATVTLWFTRGTIDFGSFKMRGWSTLIPYGEMIKDSTIAIATSILLFVWPSRNAEETTVLSWKDAQRIPFRIILLFGSGFALAEAFHTSGLAAHLAEALKFLNHWPLWSLILAIALLITIISEFASNVATIQLMLPVLASLSMSLQIDPLVLMIPATIAASFGYMMPVATAPNTIVYGTGYIPVKSMIRTGLLLNIIAILLLAIYTYFKY